MSFSRAYTLAFTVAVSLLAPSGCNRDGLTVGGDMGDHLTADLGGSCKAATTEAVCRARTDCVADLCMECSCTPTFVGCRGAGDTPTQCPLLGCAQPQCCRHPGDCSSGSACEVQPLIPSCGADPAPAPSTCQHDSDCNKVPGQICTCTPCTCGNTNQLACQDGCKKDIDCPEPQSCLEDLHCHPRACDASCTGNYTCAGGGCVRKPCAKDEECGTPGYCILGQCSRDIGQCVPQSA